jgi:putative membrane protein
MPVLTADEAAAIENAIAAFEARTGVEAVAAVERRSDVYPEVPWRAFALGAAVAALVALAGDVLRPDALSHRALLTQAATILGAGAVAALASAFVPAFGRLFIRDGRMQEEVRQRAEVLFLARELFATPGRDAILVLVSLFERRVVVVPDVAYRGRVATDEWRGVVDAMTPPLRGGRLRESFEAGLGAIEVVLASNGLARGRARHLLSDTPVQGDVP